MFYMQQKYYRADYGHFKLPVLPGWEEYAQKVKKSSENEYTQCIEKRKTNENVKKHQHITQKPPNRPEIRLLMEQE
jgi:hypothetical protein